MNERIPVSCMSIYATHYCELPFVSADERGLITFSNRAFDQLLGIKEPVRSIPIDEIGHISYSEESLLDVFEEQQVRVYLFDCTLKWDEVSISGYGHLMVCPEGAVYFFDVIKRPELDVIEKISKVNLEMSTIAREYGQQNKLLSKEVHLDALTGLYNRRFLKSELLNQLEVDRQRGKSTAVMMIDIDDFKKVNDTYGHDTGDVVLKEVARCLQRSTRTEDLVIRYGGEEFLVCASVPGQEDALSLANKLCEEVRKLTFEQVPKVSVSIGLYCADTHDDVNSAVRLADTGLYEAKRTGKDRVVLQR